MGTKRRSTKEKKNIQKAYKGLSCDSDPEIWTLYWLHELQDAGYIKNIRRAETYALFSPVSKGYVHRLKTKAISKVEILLGPHVYTPDFAFDLTEKGKSLSLFQEIGCAGKIRQKGGFNLIHQSGVVVVETKGTTFRHDNNSLEKFKVDQKWIWEKHQVYVNLWQYDNVFPKTWTPEAYKITPQTKRPRQIRWKTKSLDQYIQLK